MHAKQHNINKNDGLLKTFFRSDWTHCVFTNKNASAKSQKMAKFTIFSEIALSTVALVYFQYQQEAAVTIVCLASLLFGVTSFSNATKEQCSSEVQSYFTKTAKALTLCFLASITGFTLIALMAAIFTIDTIYGLYILQYVFRNSSQHQTSADLITDRESIDQVTLEDVTNDNKKVIKILRKGWKQNMWNVEGQVQKQICAAMVIFLQLYSCVLGVIYQTEQLSFFMIALAYSTICLASFMNLRLVRDVECIQLNITTLALTVISIATLNQQFSLTLLMLTLGLVGDSYCALRFKEDSHKIKFSPAEEFARQSWTQSAFQGDNMVLQIVACAIMFSQLSMNIIGTVYGEQICALILAFYLMRLIQFFGKVNLGVQMLQSNMACVALGIVALMHTNGQYVAMVSAWSIWMDAVFGSAIFFTQNKEEIFKQFAFIKKLGLARQAEQTISIGINLGGKVVQLGMGNNGESEYFQKV